MKITERFLEGTALAMLLLGTILMIASLAFGPFQYGEPDPGLMMLGASITDVGAFLLWSPKFWRRLLKTSIGRMYAIA